MKKYKRPFQRSKLLIAGILLFAIFLVHQSCSKIDVSTNNTERISSNPTERFFQLPAYAKPSLRIAAASMQNFNNKHEFVQKFVKDNGYPRWDKAIFQSKKETPKYNRSTSFTGGDTVIIIPLVAAGTNVVSGFIKSIVRDTSSSFDLYRGDDYSRYSFNQVPQDSISAEIAAAQMLYLNNLVFGYDKFIINDNRLFANYNIGLVNGKKVIKIKSVTNNSSSLFGEAITLCWWYGNGENCTEELCQEHGGCDWDDAGFQGNGQMCEVCAHYGCITISVGDDDDDPTGPNGPTGPPTGGGGGSNPFPCPSSQARSIPPAGCAPVNNPPITPAPPSPCQGVTNLMNVKDDHNNYSIKNAYTTVWTYGGQTVEAASSYDAAGNAVGTTGQEGSTPISIVFNCIGYVHSHSANGDYYLYSEWDMENICNLFIAGYIHVGAVIGLITPDKKTYFITIDDETAMNNFAEQFINQRDEPNRYSAYNGFFKHPLEQGPSELGLLQFIKANNMGVSLLRADNDQYTSFTQLALSSNKKSVLEIPCSGN